MAVDANVKIPAVCLKIFISVGMTVFHDAVPDQSSPRKSSNMKLLPESLQQEAATAVAVAGWALWYIDTQVLPSLLREHKVHAVWQAASRRYHDSIWKFNYAYDRELRYSAISTNMVLENLHHTKPKQVADHVDKMISANKKVYDAFNGSSKRLLIWSTSPSLQ